MNRMEQNCYRTITQRNMFIFTYNNFLCQKMNEIKSEITMHYLTHKCFPIQISQIFDFLIEQESIFFLFCRVNFIIYVLFLSLFCVVHFFITLLLSSYVFFSFTSIITDERWSSDILYFGQWAFFRGRRRLKIHILCVHGYLSVNVMCHARGYLLISLNLSS